MARRSVLFSPADRPELLWKASDSGADTVCFDLEDAVAPKRRAEARAAVRDLLADPEFDPDCEVIVRLSADAAADVDALLDDAPEPLRLDGVMVPKVAEAADVRWVHDLLAEHDADPALVALIETARGVLHAEEIADERATDALAFGAEDLAADLGATRTREGTEVLHARQQVVLAASAAGIDAIDTVYTDYDDEAGLREETRFAIELGFDGKLAIHPAQVDVINDAFTPAPERIEWAQRVLAARDAAAEEGRAVFSVDGEMIDAPLIAQAERLLEMATAAGRRRDR